MGKLPEIKNVAIVVLDTNEELGIILGEEDVWFLPSDEFLNLLKKELEGQLRQTRISESKALTSLVKEAIRNIESGMKTRMK